jgi:hypothetical protein
MALVYNPRAGQHAGVAADAPVNIFDSEYFHQCFPAGGFTEVSFSTST